VLPDMFQPPARQAGNASARVPTQGREEVKPGRAAGVRKALFSGRALRGALAVHPPPSRAQLKLAQLRPPQQGRRKDAEAWPVGIGEAFIVAPPPSLAARWIVPLIGASLICRLRVSDEIREQPISAGYVTPAARPGDLVRRLSEIIRLDCAQFVVQSIRHPLISIATNASNKTRLSQKTFFYSTKRAGVGCPAAPAGRPEADEHHFLQVLRVKRQMVRKRRGANILRRGTGP
jgi:hypothetical protein